MGRTPVDYSKRDRGVCAASMQDALSCLEGRWKMMILAHLSAGDVMRFSDLQRAIPGVSQKMLIQQLRALEQDQIISRRVHPQVPPKVEYSLAPLGQSLRPVFLALLNWADERRDINDARMAADPACQPDHPKGKTGPVSPPS